MELIQRFRKLILPILPRPLAPASGDLSEKKYRSLSSKLDKLTALVDTLRAAVAADKAALATAVAGLAPQQRAEREAQ